MKRIALALLVTGSITMAQNTKQAPPPPAAPKLFPFPAHATKKLANGLTIYVIEDHRLPLVSYSLAVLAGSAQTPASKAGLASLAGTLLREGTAKRNSEEISKLVDNAGGSLSTSGDRDSTVVNATFMRSYADLAMDLVADVTRNPAFAQDEIERNLQQIQSGLAVQYKDAEYLMTAVAFRAVLGVNPYSYPPEGTPESLHNLKREDLLGFHAKYFRPGNAFLAIAGDLKPAEAIALAEKYFGTWQAGGVQHDKIPAVPNPVRQVLVIDLPNAVQTQIGVGQPGVVRSDPDYEALMVANEIFGGSFNSRVNMKLRASEGLTYGANSRAMSLRGAGTLGVTTFTRTEKTAEAVKAILTLFEEWLANPATDEEFTESQRHLLGSFGLSLETADAVANRVVSTAINGLPEDYWSGWMGRIQGMTKEKVAAAVRKHVASGKLTVVAVGDSKEIAKSLEPFGPVTVIPVEKLDLLAGSLARGQ